MTDDFTKAILSGNLGQFEKHLTLGIHLEELDEYGFTPLIEATIANQPKIIARLLEEGAQVDNRDVTGCTALHWAADNNHISISRLLLESGADPNAYTEAGQSVLVFPYLRHQKSLKKLLYRYNASLNFAQDFIQVKLIGHRYELMGKADIIDTKGRFVAIDYEGFFLEFIVESVKYSLERYCNHFMARAFQKDFTYIKQVISLLKRASYLMRYQKYTIDINKVEEKINQLLDSELLLLPLAYEGHAISFIQYKDVLVRCDRGENSQKEGGIVIYRMHKPFAWTKTFIKQLLYQRQSYEFMVDGIKIALGLERIGNIEIYSQLVGNCSWANIEVSVLALLYLLKWKDKKWSLQWVQQSNYRTVYDHWLRWDKTRALEDCIQSFQYATPQRKATIAMILGAVLFQSFDYQREDDVSSARKLMPILIQHEYRYILQSYLKVYWDDRKTEEGYRFRQLLNVV